MLESSCGFWEIPGFASMRLRSNDAASSHYRDARGGNWEGFRLKEAGYAFFHYYDPVLDAMGASFLVQQLQRFFDGLMRESEGAVVHGDHPARLEVKEGASGVGRIRMDVAECRRIVGANRQ